MAITTLPPRVLTAEEYERYWKPQGWQLIIIGPTSTWRQDWGEWEAIRDIVQNALDEAESYQYGYDENGFWIADEGKGIAVSNFLLGPPKLKPDWARGKYGEGMKIACLALIRKGYPVYIKTVGRELWIIFFQQKVDGMAETLAALWRPDGTTRGTVFHIIGYRGFDYKDRFVTNIRRNVIHGAPSLITQPVQRFNELISEPSGRLYARDIYMKDIQSRWSYNLWSFELAPDRYAPKSEHEVYVDAGRLWATVYDVDLLAEFLEYVRYPPTGGIFEENIEMHKYEMGLDPLTGRFYTDHMKDNIESWRQAWVTTFGDDVVLRTSDRWDSIVKHLGYTPISLVYGVTTELAHIVPTDADLIKESQDRLREAEIIPDEELTRKQLAHLKLARKIAWFFESQGKAADVYAAIIPPASDRVRTAGMYSKITQEIYISVDQLESCRNTVDTVIHEIAHHISGAEDLQKEHSETMTKVAARVVELTAAGIFDKELLGVVWG